MRLRLIEQGQGELSPLLRLPAGPPEVLRGEPEPLLQHRRKQAGEEVHRADIIGDTIRARVQDEDCSRATSVCLRATVW